MSQDRTQHHKQPGLTWEETAGVLAAMPKLVRRLQHQHSPDEHRMCLACTTAGTGQREKPWPCGIRQMVDRAATIAERQQEEGP